jgi:hypothetical protein
MTQLQIKVFSITSLAYIIPFTTTVFWEWMRAFSERNTIGAIPYSTKIAHNRLVFLVVLLITRCAILSCFISENQSILNDLKEDFYGKGNITVLIILDLWFWDSFEFIFKFLVGINTGRYRNNIVLNFR